MLNYYGNESQSTLATEESSSLCEKSLLNTAERKELEAIQNKVTKYKKRKLYFTYLRKLYSPLLFVGLVAGVLCGIIIGLYQYLAEELTDANIYIYNLIRKDKRYIAAALGVNIIIGLIIGFAIDYLKEIRGSGIPYIESVARGNLQVTWYSSLPGMFIISLLGIFSGLLIGSEGPSVFLGGCIGYAIAKILKRNRIPDMLLVAAGSSAGLAVAFDAPLSGMIFALEEVYRKFSTQIILVSVITVSVSQIISHLIFGDKRLIINPVQIEQFDILHFGISLFCGVSGGILGSLFNILICHARNWFKYIKCLPLKLYVVIPEVVTVFVIYFLPDGAYGGSACLKKTLDDKFKTWEVGALLGVRIISILLCFASKTSGGIFIPMLSVGALWGSLTAKLLIKIGIESKNFSYMSLITMSSFFTAVVRAPLTAVILPVEFTEQFTGWLGPITAVAGAYIVAEFFRVEPLYEKLMEVLVEKRDEEEVNKFDEFSFIVTVESTIAGQCVRDLILPEGTTITHIIRDKTLFFPSDTTEILEGDEVFFMCEADKMADVEDMIGKVF